jgi:trehalose 6-phosphate phosphatase
MAIHWTEAWTEISTRCIAPPRLLVACDFDGTLAPLVSEPTAARLPPETLAVLRQLQVVPGVNLAFISGRALDDLIQRVPLPEAIFAGNHGLEIRGHGLDGERTQAVKLKPQLAKLTARLKEITYRGNSLHVENKGLTISVHLRNIPAADRAAVSHAVALAGQLDTSFRLQRGHLVMEYLPDIPWDKGAVVKQIAARLGLPNCAIFYAGDDTTDESVFHALPTGLTVHVGTRETTAARWSARDPTDVLHLLEKITSTRRGPA